MKFLEQLFKLQAEGYIKIEYEHLTMLSNIAIRFTNMQLTQEGRNTIKSLKGE